MLERMRCEDVPTCSSARWIGMLLATWLACAPCAGDRLAAQTLTSFAPAGWDAGLRLAEARDTNPDPKVVEIDLTARIADVEVAAGRARARLDLRRRHSRDR